MSNNKYYTPEIEEFHVGFEYDICDSSEWKSYKFPDHQAYSMFDIMYRDNLQSQYIRVKYLDQSDIEELGWNYTGKSIDIWFEKEGAFNMFSWTAYKAKLQYNSEDKRLRIHVIDGADERDLFVGLIKNKSELQRLMKQLGII